MRLELEFTGEVIHWRGPSPWYFVVVPEEECAELAAAAPLVTYGWGVIPAAVRLGGTEWTTSLFPKDGGYLVPLKAWVRRAERVDEGEAVRMRLAVPA